MKIAQFKNGSMVTISEITSELHKARYRMGLVLQAYESVSVHDKVNKDLVLSEMIIALAKHDELFDQFMKIIELKNHE